MHRYQKTLSLIVLTIIGCCSCSPEGSKEKGFQEPRFELVKVDSLIVDELDVLQITDYNPKSKRYLAYGISSKLCFELGADGTVIKELDLSGEGPGHFGQGMSGLVYLGNNIVLEGAAQYLIFDSDWNYQKQYTPGSGYIPLGAISNDVSAAKINGNLMIIKPKNQSLFGSRKLDNDHFTKAKMVELINSRSDEAQTVLSYPKNTIYQNKEVYFHNNIPHVSYNKTQQVLYLALPLEPKLFVYNMNDDFKLTESIDINFDLFRNPEGIPYEDQHKNGRKGFGPTNERSYTLSVTNSSIIGLNSEGDVTIVEHRTGTESSDFPNARTAQEVANRQSKTFTSFIKGGEVVLSIQKRFKQLVRIDESRFISPHVNEEQELDYNMFYVYELQEKE